MGKLVLTKKGNMPHPYKSIAGKPEGQSSPLATYIGLHS